MRSVINNEPTATMTKETAVSHVEVFVLAAQRVAQRFVDASEEASLLVGETVGAPGEGDAGFEEVYVSGAQINKGHSRKLTARESPGGEIPERWPPTC